MEVIVCLYPLVKDEERDICGSKLKNPSNLFKYEKQPLSFNHGPGHLNRLSQAVMKG
jgi:hypothetical protein